VFQKEKQAKITADSAEVGRRKLCVHTYNISPEEERHNGSPTRNKVSCCSRTSGRGRLVEWIGWKTRQIRLQLGILFNTIFPFRTRQKLICQIIIIPTAQILRQYIASLNGSLWRFWMVGQIMPANQNSIRLLLANRNVVRQYCYHSPTCAWRIDGRLLTVFLAPVGRNRLVRIAPNQDKLCSNMPNHRLMNWTRLGHFLQSYQNMYSIYVCMYVHTGSSMMSCHAFGRRSGH
jgi:hypothetical protein